MINSNRSPDIRQILEDIRNERYVQKKELDDEIEKVESFINSETFTNSDISSNIVETKDSIIRIINDIKGKLTLIENIKIDIDNQYNEFISEIERLHISDFKNFEEYKILFNNTLDFIKNKIVENMNSVIFKERVENNRNTTIPERDLITNNTEYDIQAIKVPKLITSLSRSVKHRISANAEKIIGSFESFPINSRTLGAFFIQLKIKTKEMYRKLDLGSGFFPDDIFVTDHKKEDNSGYYGAVLTSEISDNIDGTNSDLKLKVYSSELGKDNKEKYELLNNTKEEELDSFLIEKYNNTLPETIYYSNLKNKDINPNSLKDVINNKEKYEINIDINTNKFDLIKNNTYDFSVYGELVDILDTTANYYKNVINGDYGLDNYTVLMIYHTYCRAFAYYDDYYHNAITIGIDEKLRILVNIGDNYYWNGTTITIPSSTGYYRSYRSYKFRVLKDLKNSTIYDLNGNILNNNDMNWDQYVVHDNRNMLKRVYEDNKYYCCVLFDKFLIFFDKMNNLSIVKIIALTTGKDKIYLVNGSCILFQYLDNNNCTYLFNYCIDKDDTLVNISRYTYDYGKEYNGLLAINFKTLDAYVIDSADNIRIPKMALKHNIGYNNMEKFELINDDNKLYLNKSNEDIDPLINDKIIYYIKDINDYYEPSANFVYSNQLKRLSLVNDNKDILGFNLYNEGNNIKIKLKYIKDFYTKDYIKTEYEYQISWDHIINIREEFKRLCLSISKDKALNRSDYDILDQSITDENILFDLLTNHNQELYDLLIEKFKSDILINFELYYFINETNYIIENTKVVSKMKEVYKNLNSMDDIDLDIVKNNIYLDIFNNFNKSFKIDLIELLGRHNDFSKFSNTIYISNMYYRNDSYNFYQNQLGKDINPLYLSFYNPVQLNNKCIIINDKGTFKISHNFDQSLFNMFKIKYDLYIKDIYKKLYLIDDRVPNHYIIWKYMNDLKENMNIRNIEDTVQLANKLSLNEDKDLFPETYDPPINMFSYNLMLYKKYSYDVRSYSPPINIPIDYDINISLKDEFKNIKEKKRISNIENLFKEKNIIEFNQNKNNIKSFFEIEHNIDGSTKINTYIIILTSFGIFVKNSIINSYYFQEWIPELKHIKNSTVINETFIYHANIDKSIEEIELLNLWNNHIYESTNDIKQLTLSSVVISFDELNYFKIIQTKELMSKDNSKNNIFEAQLGMFPFLDDDDDEIINFLQGVLFNGYVRHNLIFTTKGILYNYYMNSLQTNNNFINDYNSNVEIENRMYNQNIKFRIIYGLYNDLLINTTSNPTLYVIDNKIYLHEFNNSNNNIREYNPDTELFSDYILYLKSNASHLIIDKDNYPNIINNDFPIKNIIIDPFVRFEENVENINDKIVNPIYFISNKKLWKIAHPKNISNANSILDIENLITEVEVDPNEDLIITSIYINKKHFKTDEDGFNIGRTYMVIGTNKGVYVDNNLVNNTDGLFYKDNFKKIKNINESIKNIKTIINKPMDITTNYKITLTDYIDMHTDISKGVDSTFLKNSYSSDNKFSTHYSSDITKDCIIITETNKMYRLEWNEKKQTIVLTLENLNIDSENYKDVAIDISPILAEKVSTIEAGIDISEYQDKKLIGISLLDKIKGHGPANANLNGDIIESLANTSNMKKIYTQGSHVKYGNVKIVRIRLELANLTSNDNERKKRISSGVMASDKDSAPNLYRLFRRNDLEGAGRGLLLHDAMVRAGVPENKPYFCIGYIIVNGKKIPVSSGYTSRELKHYTNNSVPILNQTQTTVGYYQYFTAFSYDKNFKISEYDKLFTGKSFGTIQNTADTFPGIISMDGGISFNHFSKPFIKENSLIISELDITVVYSTLDSNEIKSGYHDKLWPVALPNEIDPNIEDLL